MMKGGRTRSSWARPISREWRRGSEVVGIRPTAFARSSSVGSLLALAAVVGLLGPERFVYEESGGPLRSKALQVGIRGLDLGSGL